eukprot:535479_1
MSLLSSTEEWHFCMVFIVIGFITLITGLIYCKRFILVNKNESVIRARRPYYWCFTIIIHPMMILIRTTVAVLYLNNIIPIIIYRIMVTYLALLASTSVFFIRMYLLWFDLKYNRYLQQNLLRKYLLMNGLQNQSYSAQTTNSHSSATSKTQTNQSSSIPEFNTLQSYIFDNKSIFGRIKRCILPLLIFFSICFITITTIYLFDNNGYSIGIKILTIWISIVLILTIFLLQSVWFGESHQKIECKCKCFSNKSALNLAQMSNSVTNKSDDNNDNNYNNNNNNNKSQMIRTFRDDFYIRYELTGSFFIILIGLIFSLIITTSNKWGNINSKNTFNFGVFLIITVSGSMNLFGFLLYTIIPYYTYKNFLKRLAKGRANRLHQSIPLKLLLSHQTGFYAFMEQLVQEMAMENMSSLIELYQFKYKSNNKIKNMKSGNILEFLHQYHKKKKRKKVSSNKKKIETKTELKVETKMDDLGTEIAIETLTLTPNRLSINNISYKTQSNDSDDPSIDNIEFSLSNSQSDSGRSMPTLTLQQHLSFSKLDTSQGIQLLKTLPWHNLPTSEGQLKYKNKFKQAVFIYNKFYSYSSYDSVNISGNAMFEIQYIFKRLKTYINNIQIKYNNENNIEYILPTHNNTKNKNDFV